MKTPDDRQANALRAKSTALPGETHSVALAPYTPAIACATCGGTAHALARWTPPPGYDRSMRKYRCILRHDSYKTTRPHESAAVPLALTLDPERQC